VTDSRSWALVAVRLYPNLPVIRMEIRQLLWPPAREFRFNQIDNWAWQVGLGTRIGILCPRRSRRDQTHHAYRQQQQNLSQFSFG